MTVVELLDSGKPLALIDVREPVEWDINRIEGAELIPKGAFESGEALAKLQVDRTPVFYCKADCWMWWNAAKRALAYGYDMVIWYPEGTEGWRAAGLPLEAAEPVRMPDFLPIPASAAVKGRAE